MVIARVGMGAGLMALGAGRVLATVAGLVLLPVGTAGSGASVGVAQAPSRTTRGQTRRAVFMPLILMDLHEAGQPIAATKMTSESP